MSFAIGIKPIALAESVVRWRYVPSFLKMSKNNINLQERAILRHENPGCGGLSGRTDSRNYFSRAGQPHQPFFQDPASARKQHVRPATTQREGGRKIEEDRRPAGAGPPPSTSHRVSAWLRIITDFHKAAPVQTRQTHVGDRYDTPPLFPRPRAAASASIDCIHAAETDGYVGW